MARRRQTAGAKRQSTTTLPRTPPAVKWLPPLCIFISHSFPALLSLGILSHGFSLPLISHDPRWLAFAAFLSINIVHLLLWSAVDAWLERNIVMPRMVLVAVLMSADAAYLTFLYFPSPFQTATGMFACLFIFTRECSSLLHDDGELIPEPLLYFYRFFRFLIVICAAVSAILSTDRTDHWKLELMVLLFGEVAFWLLFLHMCIQMMDGGGCSWSKAGKFVVSFSFFLANKLVSAMISHEGGTDMSSTLWPTVVTTLWATAAEAFLKICLVPAATFEDPVDAMISTS